MRNRLLLGLAIGVCGCQRVTHKTGQPEAAIQQLQVEPVQHVDKEPELMSRQEAEQVKNHIEGNDHQAEITRLMGIPYQTRSTLTYLKVAGKSVRVDEAWDYERRTFDKISGKVDSRVTLYFSQKKYIGVDFLP